MFYMAKSLIKFKEIIKEKFDTKIVRNGNALAINIPAYLCKKNGLAIGMNIYIAFEINRWEFSPEAALSFKQLYSEYPALRKYTLDELFTTLLLRDVKRGMRFTEYLATKPKNAEFKKYAKIAGILNDAEAILNWVQPPAKEDMNEDTKRK